MDELIVWLIIVIFKGIWLLITTIARAVMRAARFVRRAITGGPPVEERALAEVAKPAEDAPTAALAGEVDQLAQRVMSEARRSAGEEGNAHLATALSQISDQVRRLGDRLRTGGAASVNEIIPQVAVLDAVSEVIGVMTEQRRDRELLLLLGDADALAESCYRPMIEHARAEGIELTFERAPTVLGETDLFTALYDNPARVAPIVLPREWALEVAWWPALVHELGHVFYRSVGPRGARPSLDAELRARFKLSQRISLPSGRGQLTEDDVWCAVSAWLDELFADAFGVMMLGPAFIYTMMWSFRGTPQEVITVQRTDDGKFEEHPPAHVRVVLGCRVLAEMGYQAEARHLEAHWRRQCGNPQALWFPTQVGRWAGVADAAVMGLAGAVVASFYEEGFASLGGKPLRSIPGLDFGPREHQAAIDAATDLLERRPPSTRDPRILIAGAVLAWSRAPKQGFLILRGARAHIPALDVSRRRLRLREEAEEQLEAAESLAGTEDVLADAILLDAILRRPRWQNVSR